MKLYKVSVCGTKREYFIVDKSADGAISIAYYHEIADGHISMTKNDVTNFEVDVVNLDDHLGLTLVRKETEL
jgi:hypothetical protein